MFGAHCPSFIDVFFSNISGWSHFSVAQKFILHHSSDPAIKMYCAVAGKSY